MFNDKTNHEIDDFINNCSDDECDLTVYQDLDVCVPITVEPYANLHEAEVECIGEPYIITSPCNSRNKNGTCRFNLAQKICIMIPIDFKAKATSGPTSVVCGDISDEGCPSDGCNECDDSRHQKSPFNFYIKGKRIE